MRLSIPRSAGPWRFLLRAVAASALALTPGLAAEPADNSRTAATLHLNNGGVVPGTLSDSPERGRLRWRASVFTAPFDFFTGEVSAIHFPVPPAPGKNSGETCFELSGGAMLLGNLVELDPLRAVIDVQSIGHVTVARAQVHKMTRVGDASPVFIGPAGLAGWRRPNPKDGWCEISGKLFSDMEGAALRSDFALPASASIEFELSWTKRADFILALGVDDGPESLQHAFRFEVVDDEFIVRCEGRREADVCSLGELPVGEGRKLVRVLLDQAAGRLIVPDANGKILAQITLKEKAGQYGPGLVLINQRGTLWLEHLRVQRWNGDLPHETLAGRAPVRRSDGTAVRGEIVRLDVPSKEFIVRDGASETRVAQASVASAVLAPAREQPPREVCAVAQDGSRLLADLVKVAEGAVWLSLPGVSEPVRVPVAALRSLFVTKPATVALADKSVRRGILEVEGVRLAGRLVDGVAAGDSSGLVWQPDGSASASPLRSGLSGRIVYRARPSQRDGAQRKSPDAKRLQGAGGMQGVMIVGMGRQPLVRAPEPDRPLALHLISGDLVPCEVTRIDDEGVTFRSPLAQGTFVPHAKVKAVELAWLAPSAFSLPPGKRERLLTLPRMQKESPPTHLVQSRNGDYLRGRVLKMDSGTLQFEVHLETKEIPRNRVSRIIWLHPSESPDDPKAAKPQTDGPNRASRVQAVCDDGIRLTFNAERTINGEVSGTSDVFGACSVAINELDRLLIGAEIERDAAESKYYRWQFHDAPEPQYVQADGTRPTGTESELVGKPAPDFTLDLLDGKPFHLADRKGKVVVLDFWATWCGPCLQAMPQVERVVKEFPADDVQLVGVNLEEAPKTIQALLARQKLELSVALDRDGVVAGKYKANAIPQTVVIDRQGNVARLFVGSSPHLADQLREAIKSATTGEKVEKP